MHKIELLAPAGNFECLIAAVQNGADAVYLSGKNFGARSFADNFDREELIRAVDYCHLRNTKIYVTVNTLIYDDEFESIENYLYFLNGIGVDAIIVQDIGIVELANKIVPNMPVHASTQMTIHNSYGVNNLDKLGIKRVVLSRELSLKEIEAIAKKTNIELEVFAHGALCMCYSGQCLMSSIIGSRSGNRGKCAQPCRLPYSVMNGKNKAFYMSLKDLCSVEHIDMLEKIGVTSLKIEGRMKGAAYVAAVVRVYRKYIDNPKSVTKEDIMLLDNIFNRGGLTDGYLTGSIGKDMFAFDKPDNPYHKESADIIKSLTVYEDTENKKMPLLCKLQIRENDYPYISVTNGTVFAEYKSDKLVEIAQKQPLTEEGVRSRIAKTGGTPFEFSSIDVEILGNVFLTASEINTLRREVLKNFEEKFLDSFKNRESFSKQDTDFCVVENAYNGYVCEVTDIYQFQAVAEFDFLFYYVPTDLVVKNTVFFEKYKEKIVLTLPAIMHESVMDGYVEKVNNLLKNGFCGVSVSNIDLIDSFPSHLVFGAFRLNVFNSKSLNFFARKGLRAVEISPELNIKKIGNLIKSVNVQTMIYGRLPLMITENCIIKNGGKCPCNNNGYITDRMGMRFPIIRDGESCRNIVLNCKKTFVKEKLRDIKTAGVGLFRLYFTDETPDECVKICKSYLEGYDYRPDEYTLAHYNKGAE